MDSLEKAKQWMARALSESSYVTGEAYGVVKDLTSDLTSAKEEIERLFQDAVQTQRHADTLLDKLHAAESLLTAERKETERLRGILEDLYFNARRKVTRKVLVWKIEHELTAIQSRQQEAQ